MKCLSVRLSAADVKRAIYDKDARFFKEALLSRLEEAAIQANHFADAQDKQIARSNCRRGGRMRGFLRTYLP